MAQSQLGLILYLTGQLGEAETWCKKAIERLTQGDHQIDLGDTYFRLGLVYTSQGKFDKARISLQHALKIRRALQDEVGEAHCRNRLGRLVAERGDFGQAATLFGAAQQIFYKHKAHEGRVLVYTNRARSLVYQNQPDQTLILLDKALAAAESLADENPTGLSAHILADIYFLLAQTYLLDNDIDRAKAAADRALELVKKAGNREFMAQTQIVLAQIYARQNDLAAAKIMFKEAVSTLEKLGSVPSLIRAKSSYANFLYHQPGQMNEAEALQIEAKKEAAQLKLYLPL